MYKVFAVIDEMEPGLSKPTTKGGSTIIEIPEDADAEDEDEAAGVTKGYNGFTSIAETRLKCEFTFLFEGPDRIEQHLIDIASMPEENAGAPLLKWKFDRVEVEGTLTATLGSSAVGYCTPDNNPIQIVAAKKLTKVFGNKKWEASNLQVISTLVFPLVPDTVWMYLDLELQPSKAKETVGFGFRILFESPAAKEIPDALGEGICKYLAGPMKSIVGPVLRDIVSDLVSNGDSEKETTRKAKSVSAAKDRFKTTLNTTRQAFKDLLYELGKKAAEDEASKWLSDKIRELINKNVFLTLAKTLASKMIMKILPIDIGEKNYVEFGYHIPPGAWSVSDGASDIGEFLSHFACFYSSF